MMYRLRIDTTVTQKAIVVFEREDGVCFERVQETTGTKSQAVLPLIETEMREQGITWEQISGIWVNPGPGSFTGLRVGACIAATLAWYCSLPMNGNHPGSLPDLQYGEDKWNLQ